MGKREENMDKYHAEKVPPYFIAVRYIQEKKGCNLDANKTSWAWIVPQLECYADIVGENKGIGIKQRGHRALKVLAERGEIVLRAKVKKPQVKKKLEKQDLVQAFYRSYTWRKVRMEVLIRDGRRCACCGTTPHDGVSMHVDHIKPLRLNWNLRVDVENLQVLCEVCNHGKGNWDETDWQKENATVVKQRGKHG